MRKGKQKLTFTYCMNAIARMYLKRDKKTKYVLKWMQEIKTHLMKIKTIMKFLHSLTRKLINVKIITEVTEKFTQKGETSSFSGVDVKLEMKCFWMSFLLKIGISCVPHITRDGHVQF